MMSVLETLLDMFSLSTNDTVSLVAGAVLSPAKLVGIIYGLYKACSPSYVDPAWKDFVEQSNESESSDQQHL